MTWNYRIMKRKIDHSTYEFGIYEVYYDDNGIIKGCTENSLTPTTESLDDLKFELELMKEAFDKEVLDFK